MCVVCGYSKYAVRILTRCDLMPQKGMQYTYVASLLPSETTPKVMAMKVENAASAGIKDSSTPHKSAPCNPHRKAPGLQDTRLLCLHILQPGLAGCSPMVRQSTSIKTTG
jgi:hypothetical protein